MNLNYNHYDDKDIAIAFDCYKEKGKLKEIGFTYDPEKKEWSIPLSTEVHQKIIQCGFKINRMIDHTKKIRSI